MFNCHQLQGLSWEINLIESSKEKRNEIVVKKFNKVINDIRNFLINEVNQSKYERINDIKIKFSIETKNEETFEKTEEKIDNNNII